MNIDKYKQPDDWYRTPDGIYHEKAEHCLCHILDFCGCGHPEDALKYVGQVLKQIHKLKELVWENKMTYDEWNKEMNLLGSNGAQYFIFYYLDKKEFTEHGGSVPGWLTQSGIELMQDIEELYNK